MNRLPQALAGLKLSNSSGRQASSSALLGKLMGEGEALARAPLERETGGINKTAAWLGELDEVVNSLGNISAEMQHSYTDRRLGRPRQGKLEEFFSSSGPTRTVPVCCAGLASVRWPRRSITLLLQPI